MTTYYYRFARCTVALISDIPLKRDNATAVFELSDAEKRTAEPDQTIRVTYAEMPEPPAHAKEIGQRTVWRDPTGGDHFIRFYFKNIEKSREPYVCGVRRGKRVDIGFARNSGMEISDRTVLESAGLVSMLLDAGGIVLHSSFVLHDGAAVIFSGASGAGKSTQAEMWRRAFGALVVNGDRSLITLEGSGAIASGIIWSGTSGICLDRTAPVRVIALVSHGEGNAVRPAAPIEAFRAILSQTTYNIDDPEEVSRVTAVCADLVSRVPVVRLCCLPDESAAHYLKKYLDEVGKNGK